MEVASMLLTAEGMVPSVIPCLMVEDDMWVLDRLRAAAFQAAAWVYPWRIALYISSTDYTRPLGYLYVIYTGILLIPTQPR